MYFCQMTRRKKISFIRFTIVGLLLGLTQIAPKTMAADIYSARTFSLAGAGHAAPLLSDAIYLNPSYIAYLKSYVVNFTFDRFDGDDSGTAYYGRNYTLAIQDGRTEMFQAGISYSLKEDGQHIHFALAKLIMERMGVGVGAKFFFGRHDSTPNSTDFILSATYIPTPWLQVSITMDNVLDTDNGKFINRHREFTLGTKFSLMDIMLAYFDPHITPALGDDKFGFESGLEFAVFKDLYLRVGKVQNSMIPFMSLYGSGYAFGGGWIGPRISIDYAFMRILENLGTLPRSSAHVFTVSVYF